MNQFTAIRSLTEALLECLPRLGLQIYMLVWCGQKGNECNFVETGNNALFQALLSSGISILYKIVRVHFFEKKKARNQFLSNAMQTTFSNGGHFYPECNGLINPCHSSARGLNLQLLRNKVCDIKKP